MASKEDEEPEPTGSHDIEFMETSCSYRQIWDYHPDLLKLIDEIERNSRPCVSQPKPESVHKDYMKENIKKLRDLQLKKAEEKTNQAKTISLPNKYGNVKSKVYETIHTKSRKVNSSEEGTQDAGTKAVLSIPHPLGYKPRYLIEKRRKEEEEEQKLKNERLKDIVPAGKRLLNEEERLNALDICVKRQEQILCLLNRLPVTHLTIRQERYKNGLERELTFCEEGIDIFLKPKIYIELEENYSS